MSCATFRHVVLDPENFTRFNDGVLQAALLRNAYPSELDYRADYASSDFMKAVILRLIKRAAEESGEALLEFLLALVTKRLQLVDAHNKEVLAEMVSGVAQLAALKKATHFIMQLGDSAMVGERGIPF